MPRVHTRTKAARGKEYKCASCGKPIEPGDEFFYWSRRFGRSGATYRQHKACGYPRSTQLSSRKTAQIEETLNSVAIALDWSLPEDLDFAAETQGSFDIDTSELDSAMGEIAGSAESVGEEYEESANNMPENLQYGTQAEAMREVAQELKEWAEKLRDYASAVEASVEIPSPADFDNEAAWKDALEQSIDERVGELVQAAEDIAGEMPEYNG